MVSVILGSSNHTDLFSSVPFSNKYDFNKLFDAIKSVKRHD